jgi:hypothetical protein
VTNSAQPMIAKSTVDGEITSVPESCTLQPGGTPPPPPTPAGQVTFAFCGILTEWNSEALTPLDDSSAWPRKNAANDVTREMTSVSDVSTIAFAA